MTAEAPQYTEKAATDLGYDWALVQYLTQVYPDLLERMWENESPHFKAILENDLTDEKLLEVWAQVIGLKDQGDVYDSTRLLIEFRASKEKEAEE